MLKGTTIAVKSMLCLAGLAALCLQPIQAREDGREPQVIEDKGGSLFMEEVPSEKTPAKPRANIPVDLDNIGVQTDRKGNIVPLINRNAGSVQQSGSDLQVYSEGYIPSPYVNPYAAGSVTPYVNPWGGSNYSYNNNYNPYAGVPAWPNYYPSAGAWPYGRQYYPGLMGGSYNLNLGGGSANFNYNMSNTGLGTPMFGSNIVPFGNPARGFGWLTPGTNYQYQGSSIIRPLFAPLK